MGSIRIRMLGEVPSDLVLYISENYQDVKESNATWTFRKPTSCTIFPKDQSILNPKKQTDKDKRKFQQLYLVFDTNSDDAQLQVQVTFPDEEKLVSRRRQAQDTLNEAMGNDTNAVAVTTDGLTMEEREEQAEKNFLAIKERVLARQGSDKYHSNIDFVEQNIVAHEDEKMYFKQKRDRIDRNTDLIKRR